MKKAINLLFFSTIFLLHHGLGQDFTFDDKNDFLVSATTACPGCIGESNPIDGNFPPNADVTSIPFGLTTISFPGQVPRTFAGGWQHPCGQDFNSLALLPQPTFNSNSLVLDFSNPVLAFGASVYDDHDGSPLVNVVSLTITTCNGNSLIVNEKCSSFGEAGFLGATSIDGIVQAVFSISGSGGNLEIDELIVFQDPNSTGCQPACDANNHVYWTDWATNNIRRGNHDGTGATTIISSENTPRGIELDLENDKLYFADGQSNVIKRANLDGSGKSVVTSASEPVDLALDLENNRLFYADTGDDKIKRVNLDGTNAADIKTGLVNPQGVAYDENLELLFWSDVDGQVIQTANGDGSNVQTIVTNHTPLRIALDKVNQKIYWVERSPGLIKCVNYDGSNLTIVSSISTATGIKIDNAYNKVYWNENGSNSIKRMNFDGTNQETVFSGLPGLSGIALDLGCLALTTEEQIDELEDLIADLENLGSLNQGNANALYNKLTSILQKLENGQIGAACSKLNAFIIQVGNFINNGSLTQAEGQPLLNLAADIMDQIGCNGARFSDSEESGDIVLHQNYPNPAFNQFETNISFYLPFDTKVRIQVFDIYGRLISSLVDEHLLEGDHIVPFQTQSMKSGLYLYRLEAKNFMSTRSMVILNE